MIGKGIGIGIIMLPMMMRIMMIAGGPPAPVDRSGWAVVVPRDPYYVPIGCRL
jgi:hypothetical protein